MCFPFRSIFKGATVTPQDPNYYEGPEPDVDPPTPFGWVPYYIYRQS
jgi:hypothetical protein